MGTYPLSSSTPATTAQWQWNGGSSFSVLSSESTPALAVMAGDNFFVLSIMAEDGSTTVYSVAVHRLSSDARLQILFPTPFGAGFTPAWNPDTFAYTVLMPHATSTIQLTLQSMDPLAALSWAVNAGPLTPAGSLVTVTTAIAVGNNTITARVTSEDALSTKDYTLIVYRLSSDSSLSGLNCSGGALTPPFLPAVTSYTIIIPAALNTITFTPVFNCQYDTRQAVR